MSVTSSAATSGHSAPPCSEPPSWLAVALLVHTAAATTPAVAEYAPRCQPLMPRIRAAPAAVKESRAVGSIGLRALDSTNPRSCASRSHRPRDASDVNFSAWPTSEEPSEPPGEQANRSQHLRNAVLALPASTTPRRGPGDRLRRWRSQVGQCPGGYASHATPQHAGVLQRVQLGGGVFDGARRERASGKPSAEHKADSVPVTERSPGSSHVPPALPVAGCARRAPAVQLMRAERVSRTSRAAHVARSPGASAGRRRTVPASCRRPDTHGQPPRFRKSGARRWAHAEVFAAAHRCGQWCGYARLRWGRAPASPDPPSCAGFRDWRRRSPCR